MKQLCAATDTVEMFTCPRMPGGLRLSPASCASSYQRGKKAEKWETAHLCQGCDIGAQHAGEVVAKIVERPMHRCRACGAQSYRLVHGIICVSCFNRLAEALKGKNARGKMPLKWRAYVNAANVAMVRRGRFLFAGQGRLTYISRAPQVLPGSQRSLWDTHNAD